MKRSAVGFLLGFLAVSVAGADSVLFDFENAPLRSPLPVVLTVGDLTATISSTGLGGYSIQAANTMGFTPAGFAGNCLYPSSISAADLHIGFSKPLTDFSILYAPQELGCDSSATMRVTAYRNGVSVGTATTNATDLCPCTWQSQTLGIRAAEAFDSVVVHYDARPACQDYGTIFMADNMTATPAPPPVYLSSPACLANGAFQFSFTNTPGASFSVLGTTNLSLPIGSWTILTGLAETAPGLFQFTDSDATNGPKRFYRIRSL